MGISGREYATCEDIGHWKRASVLGTGVQGISVTNILVFSWFVSLAVVNGTIIKDIILYLTLPNT